MKRNTKMDDAVANLIAACGFDKSESASEWFLHLLYDAVEILDREIKMSHREGLCLDVAHVLAGRLTRMAPIAVKDYKAAQGMK